MALNLEIQWCPPVKLYTGELYGVPYWCDLESIPTLAGLYIFAREWGGVVTPLYIGKATNLRRRIRQHFERSVRLMTAMTTQFRSGQRQVRFCTLVPKRGQVISTALDVAERALIEHTLTQGFELFNKAGTKLPSHTIGCTGKMKHHSGFPRRLHLRVR